MRSKSNKTSFLMMAGAIALMIFLFKYINLRPSKTPPITLAKSSSQISLRKAPTVTSPTESRSATPPTESPSATPSRRIPQLASQFVPTCKTEQKGFIDLEAITPKNRPKVELFINIPVAGNWSVRRKVLRETWLSTVSKYSVAYRFFTDGIDIKDDIRQSLLKENDTHHDIVFLPTKTGYWLTHRYLYAMFWGYKHYNFSFYLKVDDDYFVCLNNLVNDLQYRKHEKLLYWGWMGCDPKMVAMDEGFLIISVDLAQEIMKRNKTLCCHPFGGQMVAMWVNRLEREGYDVTYFPDNSRLMHYRSHLKKEDRNMCKNIFGVHQSYPKYMARYWNITKDSWFNVKPDEFRKVERKEYSHYCSRPKVWDWRVLIKLYRHEPKPCWLPGLRWPELEKYKAVQSRELEEKKD